MDRRAGERGVHAQAAGVDHEVFLDRLLRPDANLPGEVCAAIGDVDQVFAGVQLERGLRLLERLQKVVAAVLGRMAREIRQTMPEVIGALPSLK